jgi:CRP-like cAMP-binding protein/CheY-like chemotaxis protein
LYYLRHGQPEGSILPKPKRQKILIVDDDSSIVQLVGAQLEPAEGDVFTYDAEAFTDPRAALERARTQVFDAVISDYRMSAMDGIAFLKAFTVLQPQCARLVLSGRSDAHTVLHMVEEAAIHGFVPKPWRRSELVTMLNEAIVSVANPAHGKGKTLPRPTSTTLRTSSLLAELPDAALEHLARVADWQVYGASDVILRQNETSKSVYFVISGYVKVMRDVSLAIKADPELAIERRARPRPMVMMALLGPGDIVGELALMLDAGGTPSILALTPCQVIRFASGDLAPCLNQYPQFAAAIARKMAQHLMAAERQITLMRGDLEGRIHAITRHCQDIGLDTQHWLTKAEIARLVGATRVAVSQVMARMHRQMPPAANPSQDPLIKA